MFIIIFSFPKATFYKIIKKHSGVSFWGIVPESFRYLLVISSIPWDLPGNFSISVILFVDEGALPGDQQQSAGAANKALNKSQVLTLYLN